jgi:hypothetical protein
MLAWLGAACGCELRMRSPMELAVAEALAAPREGLRRAV